MPLSNWARIDNNSANNPALNLTGDAAIQFTFVNETPTGGAGDYDLDQPTGGGTDPDTMVEIDGTSYSFTFELTGTMPTQKKDGAQQVPDQYEGSNVAIITVQDYPTAGETTRFAFLIDEQATQTEMDDFGNGAIDIQSLDETPPATPICFARGTLILTPDGERPIEDLAVGDLVMTAGGAAMPIHHITYQKFLDLTDPTKTAVHPIRIKRDSFGAGQPHRDLVVSPNHRITLRHWAVELLLGEEKVFCPAKFLGHSVAKPFVPRSGEVEYFNLLLAEHAEILANGLAVESLFPGEYTLTRVSRRDLVKLRHTIRGLCGGASGYGRAALATITRREMHVFRTYAGSGNNRVPARDGVPMAA